MFSKIVKTLRNNILTGLFLITPIAIAIFVVQWLFTLITDRVMPFIPRQVRELHPELMFRLIALVLFLAVLFLLGLFVRNILGARLYRIGDAFFSRIPIFNKVYVSVRQIGEALLAQSQTLFQQVVLVEYPRKGLFSMGFVTNAVPPEFLKNLPRSDGGPMVAIFIPTTPNPTSGLFVFVPRNETYGLPISVGDAMKLVVSGGAVYPGNAGNLDDRPTFLDKLQKWAAREGRLESGADKPSS